MIQFDEHMFQMGWFNHQLVIQGISFTRSNHLQQLHKLIGVVLRDVL